MQIERIYKPDVRSQMYAIMLILRLRPRFEHATPFSKEIGTGQRSAQYTTRK
jgi:hypothetical protein